MAKKDAASKRLAEEIARADARYTINLQRAFGDLQSAQSRASLERTSRPCSQSRRSRVTSACSRTSSAVHLVLRQCHTQ